MISHLATGYDLAEVAVLSVLTALTVTSWALRPASRRLWTPSRPRNGSGSGVDSRLEPVQVRSEL
jgi:hypothetical protein